MGRSLPGDWRLDGLATFGRAAAAVVIAVSLLAAASMPAVAATVIDAAAVSPVSAPVGVATQVVVTATITEPTVLPDGVNLQRLDSAGRVIAILGLLKDDGLNGDVTAGDRVFSFRMTVFETAPGPMTVRVSAAFQGKLLRAFSPPLTVSITGATATGIALTAPANLAYLNTPVVNVTGTLGDPGAAVTVNGIAAAVSANSFQLTVPLVEGTNTLTAVAQNTGGTTSTASVQVTLDTTPPRVTVESPADGLVTTDAALTVAGTINDIVVGTVNTEQAQVTVNGVAAQVANRSFVAANIPLSFGENTIQVIGRDRSGNQATAQLQVRRDPQTRPSIKVASGNNQSGRISTVLASPLAALLVDALGNPVSNTPVVFEVTDNDGRVIPAGQPGALSAVVNTNASGQAQVTMRLGSRAGAGGNRVKATATGFDGAAEFTATGTPSGATLITVDSGNGQTGALGERLAFPFVVVVTDAGFNRIGGVPVTFTVRGGGGNFSGKPSLTMVTDPDGRAAAFLTLGTEPGFDNNVVQASFAGNPGFPAGFVATAKAPGNADATLISGVVLDNSNDPIEGVTVRLFLTHQGNNNNTPMQVGTPVQTDENGTFLIQPAPIGFFKLMADGTTVAPERGTFPTLDYDIVTVAGQNNTLGMPVFLPALDVSNKLCVDETTGGILTLPEVPGFSLTVAANSATFPGGARAGCVTVSTVNADKVPMAPGFGQQPRFIVTIQPVGTTFNPPAAITMPNVDGLLPGQVTELYSYDHDLAAFTAIGTGTVTPDGLLIRSDPGVGILKAGWHCGGNPNSTGSAASLNLTANPTQVTKGVNEQFSVTANGTPPLDAVYSWQVLATQAGDDAGAVTLVSSPSCPNQASCTASIRGVRPGTATLRIRFRCTTTNAEVTTDVRITIYKVTIEKPTGDPVSAGSADNEFTYAGAANPVATILVRAKIEPAGAVADVAEKIRWSFASTPPSSVLSWDAAWPGDPAKGKGITTNAKLTGLPASNAEFGLRTVRMEVVENGAVVSTETTNIELFFERDTVVTPFAVPNWFRFWLEAIGGRADTAYGGGGANYGEAPGMLHWSYGVAPPKTRVDIFDLARTQDAGDACSTGGLKPTSGIDTFEDTVLHEGHHTVQIAQADPLVAVAPNTAWRYGWSWNQGGNHNHWTVGADGQPGVAGVDDDGDGTIDNQVTAGPGELGNGDDVDLTDTGDPILLWPKGFGALPPLCWPTNVAIEKPAYDKEPDNEDARAGVDWANPGKQHRTRSFSD